MYNQDGWKSIREGENVLKTVRKISDRLLQLFHDEVDVYKSVEEISDLLDDIHEGVDVLVATVEEDFIVMNFAKVRVPIAKNITIPLSKKCLLCYIFDKGEEVYLKNLWDFSKEGYKLTALRRPSYGEKLSFLGIPIKSHGETIGIVGFMADGYDSISDVEREAFRLVADNLGFFMKRNLQRNLSDIDKLTGAMKREKFLSMLGSLSGYSSVLIVKIKDLRRIDKALGYDKGSEVIRSLAVFIRYELKPDEMLVRLRNDEFALILKRKIDPAKFVENLSRKVTQTTGIPVDLEYGYSEIRANIEYALNNASIDMKSFEIDVEKRGRYTLITEEDIKKFENSDKGIAIHNIERILYANKRILKMMGFEKLEDLEGYNALSFTADEYKEMAYRRAKLALEAAANLPPAIEKGFMSDGRLLTVVVNTFPVMFKGEKAVMITIEDISSYIIRESAEIFLKAISDLLSKFLSDSPDLCKNLLKLSKEILPDMNIAIFEIKDKEYILKCGRILQRELSEMVFSPDELPIVKKYVIEGKSVLIPDISKIVERCECPFGLDKEGISHYGHPIKVDGKIRFVLMVSKRGYNSIKPYEIDLLRTVAKHLENSLSIEALKKEIEKFKEKAFKDPLTGAYTRMFFKEWLKSYEEKLKRLDEVSSVVFMDIDCLKTFNDTYGHDFGDKVLKRFSQDVMKSIRDMDILVRWGGDEFILLLQGADGEKALDIIKRVESSTKIPFSYGISFVSRDKSFDEAVKEADEMLYRKKRSKSECEEVVKSTEILLRCEK